MLSQNHAVTVTVANQTLPGYWATKTGGQASSDDTKFRPGGMQPQISFGGPTTVENVTVSRLFDETMRPKFHWLSQVCGRANMSVTVQPLDADGNVMGKPHVYSGKLVRVTPPDADANSADVALIELELSPHGNIV